MPMVPRAGLIGVTRSEWGMAMSRRMQLVGQVVGILVGVGGILSVLFALKGESALYGPVLPLMHGGLLMSLGAGILLTSSDDYPPSAGREWLFVCLAVVAVVCCVGSSLTMWDLLQ